MARSLAGNGGTGGLATSVRCRGIVATGAGLDCGVAWPVVHEQAAEAATAQPPTIRQRLRVGSRPGLVAVGAAGDWGPPLGPIERETRDLVLALGALYLTMTSAADPYRSRTGSASGSDRDKDETLHRTFIAQRARV